MRSRGVEILSVVVLLLCTSPVLATIHFKDGGIQDIDYQINDNVWVDYKSPGLETTLNILDGATIPYPYRVIGCEESIINILGGWINYLRAYDSSQVSVSGGSVDWLYASESSQVAFSGGSMGNLAAGGSSQVTVSGGSIKDYLLAVDSSQVAVSGGSMDWLAPCNNSKVTVSGGSINKELWAYDSSQVTISGGSIGKELRIWENAVLTMHGWDFAVDGTPVGYIELYSIFGGHVENEAYRQLTGTLLSGDPLNNNFRIGKSGKIVLVPEPATVLLLGLGGLALIRNRIFR